MSFVGWLSCESPLTIVLFSPCQRCFQCCEGSLWPCHESSLCWSWLAIPQYCYSSCMFPLHILQNIFSVYSFSSLIVLTMQGIFLSSFHMSGKILHEALFALAVRVCVVDLGVVRVFHAALWSCTSCQLGPSVSIRIKHRYFFIWPWSWREGEDGSNIPLISAWAALSFTRWHCSLPENL